MCGDSTCGGGQCVVTVITGGGGQCVVTVFVVEVSVW